MDVTHYLFAFFVFVLVCVAIWLFGRVMRGGKKEETGIYEKEQRLFKLYQNVEDMMNSFEEYVDETKKEIDERLGELKKTAEEARVGQADVSIVPPVKNNVKTIASAVAPSVSILAPVDGKNPDAQGITLPDIPDGVKDMPVEQAIALLLDKGLDSMQIAKYLGISNREVTLIVGLKKMSGGVNLR